MLTNKQKTAYDFIKAYSDDNGAMPTLHEVADAMGIKSVSTVHQHIKELIKKDYITQSGDYGALEIEDGVQETSTISIIGTITAGQPITAIEEEYQDAIEVAKPIDNSKFYALKVAGNSMVEDGIHDGDIVIIKRQETAIDGQTVVAVIDDNQATLKRIYKEPKRFRLQPANQTIMPIFRKEVEIRGIVWEVRRSYNNLRKENKPTKKWKTLDLFAGIGGIRLGFEKAGFTTAFANDFEPACKTTYDLNFKEAKLIVEDLTKIKADDLPEFDFLLGGFPCQAFSIAGYRHGFKDKKGRGNLFFDIARIIEARQPEGFLLENVKNLRTHDGGNTFKVIEKTLKELGYTTKTKVLNSMEYGNVPQNRERIFIVGFKDALKTEEFEFPKPLKLTKTIPAILEKNVDEKYYYRDKPLHSKLKKDVNEQGAVYQWRRQYVRKNKKGVCPTLTANMGMGGHNVPIVHDGKGIRKLTPRECARIQGYPDSYKLPSDLPDSKLYKQIGNSVSVPVLERIAKQMAKVA